MGIEIERKFLVKSDGWRKLGCAVRYAQGYLCSDRNRTVRVRTVGDKGFLTVKGRGSGIAHPEYEYEIPYNEARTMLDELAEKPVIAKTRTKIPFAGFVWEVDEFFGDNEGGRTAPMTKVTFQARECRRFVAYFQSGSFFNRRIPHAGTSNRIALRVHDFRRSDRLQGASRIAAPLLCAHPLRIRRHRRRTRPDG